MEGGPMLKECDNCGKEFLTEADTFVYQARPQGEYYSCGCIEFKYKIQVLKDRIDCIKNEIRVIDMFLDDEDLALAGEAIHKAMSI